MSRIKVARYRLSILTLGKVKGRLLGALHTAGYEPFSGPLKWRINDTLNDDSKVTIVAYRTGAVVVSGHGPKFDLTTSLVKTYDIVRTKQ